MSDEFEIPDNSMSSGQPLSTQYQFGHIVSEIENIFGRQSTAYISKLVNDALLEIGSKRQNKIYNLKTDLKQDKRWYDLPPELIDIVRVEIKDTNDRYVMIPKLSDPHKLLKEDEV